MQESKFEPHHSQPSNVSPARDVVMTAVKTVANSGVRTAKTGFFEVQHYVQENPQSLRALCFLIALALLIFSILGVLNIFDAVFKPHQYLIAFYNAIFAGVIIVADGKPEWFKRCWDVQTRLFNAAAFLASQAGRAALYFYVGSINLFMLPENPLWKLIYICLGVALCFLGALMLLDSWGGCCCCCGRHQPLQEPAACAEP